MPQQKDDGDTIISEQYGTHAHGCFTVRDTENDDAFLEMEPMGVWLQKWR